MLTCRRAAERYSRSLDGPLPAGDRLALAAHLLMCAHCRRFGRQLQALDAACREAAGGGTGSPPGDVRLPDATRERILAALTHARPDEG